MVIPGQNVKKMALPQMDTGLTGNCRQKSNGDGTVSNGYQTRDSLVILEQNVKGFALPGKEIGAFKR